MISRLFSYHADKYDLIWSYINCGFWYPISDADDPLPVMDRLMPVHTDLQQHPDGEYLPIGLYLHHALVVFSEYPDGLQSVPGLAVPGGEEASVHLF